ncbi:MAG: hypothetical protein AAF609_05570 [Cyanobacteria bacterium P01_C01_bin.120]
MCAAWDSTYSEAAHTSLGNALEDAAQLTATEEYADASVWVEWETPEEQRYLLAVFQEVCED